MINNQEQRALALVRRLLDPEDLGHAATPEIRDYARRVLGFGPVETARPRDPVIPQPQPERRGPLFGPKRPNFVFASGDANHLGKADGRRFWPVTPAGQSRVGSLIECLVNVAIGYGVALASQLVVFPHFGIEVSLLTNIKIGLWFTVISIARSYLIRRFFNGLKRKT